MTTTPIPLCESCALLGPGPDTLGHACQAFPDGIPEGIYPGGFDHRRPHAGDRGIRWQLSPEAGAAARLDAYERSLTA